MNSWRKFRRLPAGEKIVLLRALALLLLVRAGLRAFGWRRMQAALTPRSGTSLGRGDRGGAAMARARRTAHLVAAASRVAGGTCLARSIVLTHILAGQGTRAELRIGVRNADQKLEAHAWVEVRGAILNDGPDTTDRFAAFDRNFAVAQVNWK